MIKSHEREKLINAALYFAVHTRHFGKIKLFKLLYLLDFEHFRQTGRSVTGLEYRALKLGPVPMAVMEEWERLEPDFADAVDIVPEPVIDYVRERVVPKRAFVDSHFTRRELRLMGQLAESFRDEYTRPLIDLTHDQRGPWAAIWDDGRGNLQRIPYALAIRAEDPHAEVVREAAREYEGIRLAQLH